jgi:hypothetical protein
VRRELKERRGKCQEYKKLEKGVIMKREFGIARKYKKKKRFQTYLICRVRRRDHKSIAFSLTSLIF